MVRIEIGFRVRGLEGWRVKGLVEVINGVRCNLTLHRCRRDQIPERLTF
jgi:hypothetical protein